MFICKFRCNFTTDCISQLDAILGTDEPSAFLLQLVQGLVNAFGAEIGEWSVLKTSLKTFFPSMHTSSSFLTRESLVSVDFNGDYGASDFRFLLYLQF